MMPKYSVEHLSEGMLSEMIEKTRPRPEYALIDWKGLRGADKDVLIGLLEGVGLEWRKTSELK